MANDERYKNIRIRYIKKPLIPIFKGQFKIIDLSSGEGQIGSIGKIILEQFVNGNVQGRAVLKNGSTAEQPNRKIKDTINCLWSNVGYTPFTLETGQELVIKKGREQAVLVNRNRYLAAEVKKKVTQSNH